MTIPGLIVNESSSTASLSSYRLVNARASIMSGTFVYGEAVVAVS